MGSFADSINCPTSYLQALSDAQQFLFEERQRLLLLQAENE
jgi:hypothetical protein